LSAIASATGPIEVLILRVIGTKFSMKSEIDIEIKNRHSYTMGKTTPPTTIESSMEQFIGELDKNPSTIRAYRTDIRQFIAWLHANDITVISVHHITSSHINEYFRDLANQGRTSTTCARKLVSIHVFFTYLMHKGVIQLTPTAKVKKPRKEGKPKHVLRLDEFQRIIGAAKGNVRDYALLQLLFHAGIRVSEVIAICLSHLDMEHSMLALHRKGNMKRKIPLEEKVMHGLQSYLAVRPMTTDQHLFLNYNGQGLSIGGVRKMVEKYARCAGIPKKITCHSLYFTCSTHSSVLGMIDFYPKTPLRNEHVRTQKTKMPLGPEELRKLLDYTSL
jgi:site-specific recombinase XerD